MPIVNGSKDSAEQKVTKCHVFREGFRWVNVITIAVVNELSRVLQMRVRGTSLSTYTVPTQIWIVQKAEQQIL